MDEFAKQNYRNALAYYIRRLQRQAMNGSVQVSIKETWQKDALCAQTTEHYWDSAATIESARPICAKCPVQAPCLEQGLRENIPMGGRDFPTFAGYTGEQLYELKQLNKKLRKARRDPA